MKARLFKIAALFVALATVFGIFAACAPVEDETLDPTPSLSVIQETDIYLVRGGVSEYKIVIPKDAHSYIRYAAEELAMYFAQSTGAQLDIVTDETVINSASTKFITLGPVTHLVSAGITADLSTLGAAGFVIKRVGSNLHICGGDYLGTLYGVYEFLAHQFGFEVYAIDEIALQKNIQDKFLLDFDLSDKPDIPYRNAYGNKYYFNELNAQKMRFNVTDDIFVKDSPQPWHNSLRYLPPEEYRAQHPDWYMPGNQQLSYTANGNAAELVLMQQEVIKKIKEHIQQSYANGKYLQVIAFTHEDNGEWATDPSMDIYTQKYGAAAPAASLIHFLNPIAREIGQFMQDEYPGYEMNIVTFAYWTTEAAPVKLENGVYLPIDESVVMEPNLSVLYAPIRANFLEDFSHSTNQSYKDTLDKWSVLSQRISFWLYTTNFNNYLMLYDSFNSMQNLYRMVVDYNAFYLFCESAWNYGNAGFNALKEYLGSKLMWDTEADMAYLTDMFFDNYYKQASDTMRDMYESLRLYTAYLKTAQQMPGGVFTDMDSKAYWPEAVLNDYLKRIDQAYADIEPLKKSDTALYNKLYDRICGEGLFFRYQMMRYYPTVFSPQQLKAQLALFKADCERLNINSIVLNTSIKDLEL